ncbi:BURP domain-containing protein 12-like [Trifolium pratense]|uniref:BURP domain-containing protein 12-like n=1 Tax=Trifolium pratense TaxID=57577 RepID=UPI001E693C59|nr:BURP domain-containing protein 12-like [Trifolium pratense]
MATLQTFQLLTLLIFCITNGQGIIARDLKAELGDQKSVDLNDEPYITQYGIHKSVNSNDESYITQYGDHQKPVDSNDEPYIVGYKTQAHESNEPYITGYKTKTRDSNEPYIAGYKNLAHVSNEPYIAGYKTHAHESNEPYISGYKNQVHGSNEPYITGYKTQAHESNEPYIAGYKTHAHESNEPYISGYKNQAHGSNEPYITGYKTQAHESNEPYIAGYKAHAHESNEPYISGYKNQAHGSNEPYITGYKTQAHESNEPYIAGYKTHAHESTEPYITGYKTQPYIAGYKTRAHESNEPYIAGYKTHAHESNKPYITGYKTQPYIAGYKTHTHDSNEPYITSYGNDESKQPNYITGYKSHDHDSNEPYIAGDISTSLNPKGHISTNPEDPQGPLSSNLDRTNAFKTGFFNLDDLHVGNVMTLQFPVQEVSHFLSRKEADSPPLSMSQLQSVLQFFSISKDSPQAKYMKRTLEECEGETITGETKICASSLKSMLQFVDTIIGSDTKHNILTTSNPSPTATPLQKYTILEVSQDIYAPKWVACHPLPYPYAIYYCHYISTGTKVFKVSLIGDENGDKMEALGICHLDTSDWNPDHIIFKQLGIKAGKNTPVCHFFPVNHLLWVPIHPSKVAM